MTLEDLKGLLEKATPGPWRVDPQYARDIQDFAGDKEICTADMLDYETGDTVEPYANAALIAAAPELAALVVRLVEGLRVIRDAGGTTTAEGLSCSGSWCAEQARTLLRELGVTE